MNQSDINGINDIMRVVCTDFVDAYQRFQAQTECRHPFHWMMNMWLKDAVTEKENEVAAQYGSMTDEEYEDLVEKVFHEYLTAYATVAFDFTPEGSSKTVGEICTDTNAPNGTPTVDNSGRRLSGSTMRTADRGTPRNGGGRYVLAGTPRDGTTAASDPDAGDT